jgi:threonine/homoserine/homoserine lactone efflux protein
MELAEFLLEVVAVSASGVLAPGPLFLANLLHGARYGSKAGLKMAYGHTVVELPLILVLATGIVTSFVVTNSFLDAIGIVGGVAMLGFATIQLLSFRKTRGDVTNIVSAKRGPFLTGIVLTGVNPFFLGWWFTVGLKIIADSLTFGFATGMILVFGFHIWMDYAWLTGTAYLSFRGASMLNSKYYTIVLLALVGVLIYFGLTFILASLT